MAAGWDHVIEAHLFLLGLDTRLNLGQAGEAINSAFDVFIFNG